MTIIRNIAHPLDETGDTVGLELIRGQTHRLIDTIRDDDGNVSNAAGWTVSIANQWFLGNVGPGPSVIAMDETTMDLGPGAELITGQLGAGLLEIVWPTGAYTGDVPPNEAMDVPVLASVVAIQNTDPVPRVLKHRFLCIYRWAP